MDAGGGAARKQNAMRVATLDDGSRDGALIVVSSDGRLAAFPDKAKLTMQSALEGWDEMLPMLELCQRELDDGIRREAFELELPALLAPLPRAWQWLDGSAFHSHGRLVTRALGLDPLDESRPLMYQGASHSFLSATQNVAFISEEDGIDFEGEFAVIVDEVPMGVTSLQAAAHIKLVVQVNDWSLRTIAPVEMRTGFGWVQAKPLCSVAPLAATPHHLGSAWDRGRVALDLCIAWNGQRFGSANGREMAFGFPELVAHAARTRPLCAGTIIGSGTVANEDYHARGSSCIAERRGIETLEIGDPRTGFMKFGDRVEMEARTEDGRAPFGKIDQRVVAYEGMAT